VTGLLLAMAASGAWGVSDFLGGVRARTVALPVVLAGSQLTGLLVLVLALLGPLNGAAQPVPIGDLARAAVAGGCGVTALGLLYVALARGGIALVAPISAGAALVSVLVGLTGGERLGPVAAVGVVLALAGTVAVSWSGPSSRENDRPGPATVLAAVGSALCSGAFFVMIQAASRSDPLTATLVNRVTACALVLAWSLGRWPELAEVRRAGPLALVAVAAIGAGDAVAELCFASASTRAPLSVVTPLASLYPAVAVLLALVLVRERLRPVATAGVCSAVLGAVLLGG
jgi:drug/metabolite transporter (DMT)-like permease